VHEEFIIVRNVTILSLLYVTSLPVGLPLLSSTEYGRYAVSIFPRELLLCSHAYSSLIALLYALKVQCDAMLHRNIGRLRAMCVETACVPVRSVPDSNALAPRRALNQLEPSSMQRLFNLRVYWSISALAEHRMPQPRPHWLINTVGSWTRRLKSLDFT